MLSNVTLTVCGPICLFLLKHVYTKEYKTLLFEYHTKIYDCHWVLIKDGSILTDIRSIKWYLNLTCTKKVMFQFPSTTHVGPQNICMCSWHQYWWLCSIVHVPYLVIRYFRFSRLTLRLAHHAFKEILLTTPILDWINKGGWLYFRNFAYIVRLLPWKILNQYKNFLFKNNCLGTNLQVIENFKTGPYCLENIDSILIFFYPAILTCRKWKISKLDLLTLTVNVSKRRWYMNINETNIHQWPRVKDLNHHMSLYGLQQWTFIYTYMQNLWLTWVTDLYYKIKWPSPVSWHEYQ